MTFRIERAITPDGFVVFRVSGRSNRWRKDRTWWRDQEQH